MSDLKILDCTLRDGGYYTNWDFSPQLVSSYIDAFNNLPVDYLEIGYRSPPMDGYLGEYFYLPEYVLNGIKERSNKRLAIILNEKDVNVQSITSLLGSTSDYIDMVRIAISPENFSRALKLGEKVKALGFEVCFNVMYMSEWENTPSLMSMIPDIKGIVDYFYMVDSYGGAIPSDVTKTVEIIKGLTDVNLGFHGHNNLELGLANTLAAIDAGVSIVDSTVTGMGRGAGNLKTELLLTVLNSQGKLDLEYNWLSNITDLFSQLQTEYEWGTNLPYMVSGANSIPQKKVMEWVSQKLYSFNTIIRAISNESKGITDNYMKLPTFELPQNRNSSCIIIGGGMSAIRHAQPIKKYLKQNPDIILIHASSKNSEEYRDLENKQIFCLVGNEGYRMEAVFVKSGFDGIAVLPPYPREMGTYIPEVIRERSFELDSMGSFKDYGNSHTGLALRISEIIKAKEVYLVGYDGYVDSKIGDKEISLFYENELLFDLFKTKYGSRIYSLNKTKYSHVIHDSIYSKA